jgi:hypothetical protein
MAFVLFPFKTQQTAAKRQLPLDLNVLAKRDTLRPSFNAVKTLMHMKWRAFLFSGGVAEENFYSSGNQEDWCARQALRDNRDTLCFLLA